MKRTFVWLGIVAAVVATAFIGVAARAQKPAAATTHSHVFAPVGVASGQSAELCLFNASMNVATGTATFQDMDGKMLNSTPFSVAPNMSFCASFTPAFSIVAGGPPPRLEVVGGIACNARGIVVDNSHAVSMQIVDPMKNTTVFAHQALILGH